MKCNISVAVVKFQDIMGDADEYNDEIIIIILIIKIRQIYNHNILAAN